MEKNQAVCCAYVDHLVSNAPNAVVCGGSLAVYHDGRGCKLVCAEHYVWRSKQSLMAGCVCQSRGYVVTGPTVDS